jgi:uncharacterized membrane protein
MRTRHTALPDSQPGVQGTAPRRRRVRADHWRIEALRTNLWAVPSALIALAVLLFLATYSVDRAAAQGTVTLPAWVNSGSADAGRQILTAIAAAIITVVGVVFSITIVALTLASTQFGPRMLRNFIRSFGTQSTLGTFVATFLFSILALISISQQGGRDFVPHLSITVTFLLVLGDLAVLVYFMHHVATSIQLNQVVADIARDLIRAIDTQTAMDELERRRVILQNGPSSAELAVWLDQNGAEVLASKSGFLQVVDHELLIGTASAAHAVVRLAHRPGHFVVEGRTLARVWPTSSVPAVARVLERASFIGPYRTLSQDMVLAIDQIVEIALRALSPAVNDTFTALACIDWLAAGLSRISAGPGPETIHRDSAGYIRLIEARLPYQRLVNGAFDKIRQAGRGMPAVTMRQLEALARIMEFSSTDEQRRVLLRQADMLLRASEEAIPEANDRLDVRARYDAVVATMRRLEEPTSA